MRRTQNQPTTQIRKPKSFHQIKSSDNNIINVVLTAKNDSYEKS
jgi:hypothetical protein